jgi:hypothetical protein
VVEFDGTSIRWFTLGSTTGVYDAANFSNVSGTALTTSYQTLVSCPFEVGPDNTVYYACTSCVGSNNAVAVHYRVVIDSTVEFVDYQSVPAGGYATYNRSAIVNGLSVGSHTLELQAMYSGAASTVQTSGLIGVGPDNINVMIQE